MVCCYTGIVLGYVACDQLSYETVPLALGALAIVFVAVFAWLPDTPQYLLQCGRAAEAELSLRWYRNVATEGARCETELRAELDKFVEIARQNARQPPVRPSDFRKFTTCVLFSSIIFNIIHFRLSLPQSIARPFAPCSSCPR